MSEYDVIDMGHGSSKISRTIYSKEIIAHQMIQVGFAKLENTHVSVWRPCDPSNTSSEAEWKDGLWRTIYRVQIQRGQHARGEKYFTHLIGEFANDQIIASLPLPAMRIDWCLEQHLKKVAAQSG